VCRVKNCAYHAQKTQLNASHASLDSTQVVKMDNAEIAISTKTRLDASNVQNKEMVVLPANNAQVATYLTRKQIIATHVISLIVMIAVKELTPVNHVLVDICLIKPIKIVRSVALISITVRNVKEITTPRNHALSVMRTLPCLTKLKT